jgi:hypothetical protein
MHYLRIFSNKGFKVRKSPFACHSEEATRSSILAEKKIFFGMLIEIPAKAHWRKVKVLIRY